MLKSQFFRGDKCCVTVSYASWDLLVLLSEGHNVPKEGVTFIFKGW